MPIHFDKDRMLEVRDAHDRWWNGTLDRPLMYLTIDNAYDAPASKAPFPDQWNCCDFSISPEEVVDAVDAEFSRKEYLGDSYPWFNFAFFGPGVLAAMSGGVLDNSSGAVWFWPPEKHELSDLHPKYDPENIYAKRIKDIYRAGLQKWEGSVIMGMPDLGGVMDVVASLRGTEDLLMDLYDEPDEVKRVIREVEVAWYDAYNDFSAVLEPQKAHTDWSGLLSNTPSYIDQCDFSYMIGNDMFREFVLDTLRKDTLTLDRTIYHLDGVGQLNHLDDILALPNLNAVQWVYGDGKPTGMNWLDVYAKIEKAGKGIMLVDPAQGMLDVVNHIHGSPYVRLGMDKSQMELAKALLAAR